MPESRNYVLLRGGGDLASGTALRLYRAGIRVLITEIAAPLAVRRRVSFSEAVYTGTLEVEGVVGRRITSPDTIQSVFAAGEVPVLVDPDLELLTSYPPVVLVDARMTKQEVSPLGLDVAALKVGLGPGFVPGKNCHAAIETNRGHNLGRVLWDRAPELDTGRPAGNPIRVLRAPVSGMMHNSVRIGDMVKMGDLITEITGMRLTAPFDGVVRGLLRDQQQVVVGQKIGDIDPRNNPDNCYTVSDKALSVGGGVLEAVLSRAEIRARLWERL